MYNRILTGDEWQKACEETTAQFDAIVKGPGAIDLDQLATWRAKFVSLLEQAPVEATTTAYRTPVTAGAGTRY